MQNLIKYNEHEIFLVVTCSKNKNPIITCNHLFHHYQKKWWSCSKHHFYPITSICKVTESFLQHGMATSCRVSTIMNTNCVLCFEAEQNSRKTIWSWHLYNEVMNWIKKYIHISRMTIIWLGAYSWMFVQKICAVIRPFNRGGFHRWCSQKLFSRNWL